MAEITAKAVMDLRDATGISMMKCKAALVASNGDPQAAIEYLRKQGAAVAGKFSGRETPNGAIGMAFSGGAGALVLLGCQTDFVANTDDFKANVAKLAQLALSGGHATVDALNAAQLDGRSVADTVTSMIQKIGENIKVVEVKRITGAIVTGYNHGGRVAALVAGTVAGTAAGTGADAEPLRKIAMHVASSEPAPVSLDRASVDKALIAKERKELANDPEAELEEGQTRDQSEATTAREARLAR